MHTFANEALETLDRAFEAWHDGDKPRARRLIREIDVRIDEAEAAGVDETYPRLLELVRETVTDMSAAEWQRAGRRLDTLERFIVDNGRPER
jgi:hypothetical protein